jgi:hypothetical protein
MSVLRFAIVFALLLAAWPGSVFAQDLSTGQTVYVPAYSHIYHGSKSRPFDLAVTLSIRNTDPRLKPERLGPLATREILVDESDSSGGSGANFVVRWSADKAVNAPIIETVMIGTQGQQGISFRCLGREILE